MSLLRKFRRSRADAPAQTATAAPAPVLDRSTLLAELEVHVPAPERLVRWDTATRACPDCTESVGRSEGRCRHCGHALV
jgi:tRNA(Ile2) C34 agmatinyltransferase TiaS